jgi:hypothetical protein
VNIQISPKRNNVFFLGRFQVQLVTFENVNSVLSAENNRHIYDSGIDGSLNFKIRPKCCNELHLILKITQPPFISVVAPVVPLPCAHRVKYNHS